MSEFLDMTRAASEALNRGETVCLATVVRVRGSAPRHTGARLLVWPDGKIHGTIGGGTLEWRVVEDARAALAEGQPHFKNYVFDTRGGPDSVGLCGGSVDVHMDILRPDPTLLIIGAGHIAQPLAQMAALLDMRAVVVDDRNEWANRGRFPTAADVIVVDYEPNTETLAPIPVPMTPSTCVVITTWGYDLPALEQAIAQNPAYIGLVASPTKARELFKRLIAKGVSPESLRRVNTPAGLDLGAESPAEVALAILAEVLAVQRSGSGQFLRQVRGRKFENLLDDTALAGEHG
ncbi:MAG: XdhC family protein [Chloroflexi bacterium]|nr:XdhC family protein [Chloroflexota bacterium]